MLRRRLRRGNHHFLKRFDFEISFTPITLFFYFTLSILSTLCFRLPGILYSLHPLYYLGGLFFHGDGTMHMLRPASLFIHLGAMYMEFEIRRACVLHTLVVLASRAPEREMRCMNIFTIDLPSLVAYPYLQLFSSSPGYTSCQPSPSSPRSTGGYPRSPRYSDSSYSSLRGF